MKIIILIFAFVVSPLSATTLYAMTPSKEAQKQTQEKSLPVKAVEGLKRQGKDRMGNENAEKQYKTDVENAENPATKVKSGDPTKAKK